jgi:hypothetical protein
MIVYNWFFHTFDEWALLRLRTTDNPLENKDRRADWRLWTIKSTGERVNGTKPSAAVSGRAKPATDRVDLRDSEGLHATFSGRDRDV